MAKKKNGQEEQLFELHDPVSLLPEGTYSGDRPNPNLRKFVEEHSTPFEIENDKYNVSAFATPITSTKATAIYNMHSYHQGKKPHDAIRTYIRHYTSPGDLVMDVFSGSGGTSLAAILEKRVAIAIDRSPASTFITKNYCSPVDSTQIKRALNAVTSSIQKEFDWLYGTVCDRCEEPATVVYTVYSQVFRCSRCLKQIASFDCLEAEGKTANGKPKKLRICPICDEKGHCEEIGSGSESFGHIPVLQSFICRRCRPQRSERSHNDAVAKRKKYFETHDLKRLTEIESLKIPYWFPPHKMMNVEDDSLPWGAEWRPGRNFRSVAELFTKRNLWAIAAIRDSILKNAGGQRDLLLFALNAITLNCSRMYRYRESLKGGFQQGTFYVPQESQIINVLRAFIDKVEDLCRASSSTAKGGDFIVSTQTACKLDAIPSNSIDYVFTDPPYSHTVQYGELNFIWEAWLGLDTSWHSEEIIVNDVRGKSDSDWAAAMKQVMCECFRVLKPGRWLTLCFHDEEGTWELVQDFMAEVGFVVDKSDTALFIDAGQKSYNQITADKARKRDLVLNFRKPKAGEWRVSQVFIPPNVDTATFRDLADQVLKDFLTSQPGATKDRVYDALISSMVRKGQMETHDFDLLLQRVADEVQEPVKKNLFENEEPNLFGNHVQSRWYLKETADQIDQAEQSKEDAVARRLATFVTDYLAKRPENEGVHYSDLFEQFLPVQDKPRRLLADWLPEYFIKTSSGTWRIPNDDESKQLTKLREQGTLRRIKRFANALIEGVPIRDKDRPASDSDSLDWLRQCRRAGLYEQGKAIYEKGGLNSANLTDEQQIEAEDDYRICARRGSEETGKPKTKKRKPKEEA